MDIKEKIEELRAELHRHNYNYYVLNAPEISDKEFDDKMRGGHPEHHLLGGDSVRCGQRLYDHLPGGPGPLHRLGHLFPEIHRVLRHPLPGHLRRGPPQRLDAQPGDVRKTVAAAAGMC